MLALIYIFIYQLQWYWNHKNICTFWIKYRWVVSQMNHLVNGMKMLFLVSDHIHIPLQFMSTVSGYTYVYSTRDPHKVMGTYTVFMPPLYTVTILLILCFKFRSYHIPYTRLLNIFGYSNERNFEIITFLSLWDFQWHYWYIVCFVDHFFRL